MELSYAHGAVGGAVARRDDRREPGRDGPALPDAEALVVRHQDVRLHLRELDADGRPRWRGACSPLGLEQGRPGRHLEPELRRVGAASSTPPPRIGVILVNINPAYRTHELEYVLAPVGLPDAGRRPPSSRRATTWRWSTRCGRRCPTLERVVFLGTDDWDELVAGGADRVGDDELAERGRRRCASTTRSTSSTRAARPASPRAPRSPTTTSSTTATSSARAARYTERDRVCIPVPFYHCFGMVLGNLGLHHARRRDGDPRRPRSTRRHARDGAGRAVHQPLRRADDVHRRARPSRLRRLRPVVAAHRHHGRLAVPGRGDEAVHRRRCTWTRSRSATA